MKSKALIQLHSEPSSLLAGLGNAVTNARHQQSLSIQDLAKHCKISRPTLYRLENGQPTVSIGVLATVLSSLGLAQEFESFLAHNRKDTPTLPGDSNAEKTMSPLQDSAEEFPVTLL